MRASSFMIHAAVVVAVVATAASATALAAVPWPWRGVALAAPVTVILALGLAAVHLALRRFTGELRARWAFEHDALTRLLNHGQMSLALVRARTAARHAQRPLAVVLIDVDGLGPVNDAFGRPVGDRVLAEIGDACRRAARPGDQWARWSGGRFLGLLADSDGRTARILAEQVRAAVTRLAVATREGVEVRVTVSGGVAVDPPDAPADSIDDLVDAADRALYAAKRAGGDRVRTATLPRLAPPPAPAAVPA